MQKQIAAAFKRHNKAHLEVQRLESVDDFAIRAMVSTLQRLLEVHRVREGFRHGHWAQEMAHEIAELDRLDVGTLANRAATLRAALHRHEKALETARRELHEAQESLCGLLRSAEAEVRRWPEVYVREESSAADGRKEW